MGCRDTIHLICWYLEGRLSKSVEAEIEEHLECCADCRMNTLDRYFGVVRTPASESASRAA